MHGRDAPALLLPRRQRRGLGTGRDGLPVRVVLVGELPASLDGIPGGLSLRRKIFSASIMPFALAANTSVKRLSSRSRRRLSLVMMMMATTSGTVPKNN